MAVQAGKDLLLKLDLDGSGLFATVAGLRSHDIKMNAELVDITTMDSRHGWRELLPSAGMRSLQVTGKGIFTDSDTDLRMRQVFLSGMAPEWRIIVPSFGSFVGAFQITNFNYGGVYDAELTFEITLTSAGEIRFIEE